MPSAPNFDPIARPYRWAEYLTLGPLLQRTRTHFLPRLTACRRALLLGDGDGRFLARLLHQNPSLQATAVDTSASMLHLLQQRCPTAQTIHADIRYPEPGLFGLDPGISSDPIPTPIKYPEPGSLELQPGVPSNPISPQIGYPEAGSLELQPAVPSNSISPQIGYPEAGSLELQPGVPSNSIPQKIGYPEASASGFISPLEKKKGALAPDLIVTHFFLDCLTQPELNNLAARLAAHTRPGALWLLSDFGPPHSALLKPLAALYIRSLYLAFRILTGLRVTHLPDPPSALTSAGFHRIARHDRLFGLLYTELWQRR